MYYCTIYMQPKGRLTDKSLFEVYISLSYTDKVDAERYKKDIIQQALAVGGKLYLEEDDYTTITGNFILKTTGAFAHRGKNVYRIGVESESSKFSVLPFKAKSSVPIYKVTDGLAYEIRLEELKQRKLDEIQAKQDEAKANLQKFESEIKPMTDLSAVLKTFVKYSNQRSDKEKLAAIVIKKIQKLSEK